MQYEYTPEVDSAAGVVVRFHNNRPTETYRNVETVSKKIPFLKPSMAVVNAAWKVFGDARNTAARDTGLPAVQKYSFVLTFPGSFYERFSIPSKAMNKGNGKNLATQCP